MSMCGTCVKKIDEGHPQKLLRTVRGVGYSVSDEVPE